MNRVYGAKCLLISHFRRSGRGSARSIVATHALETDPQRSVIYSRQRPQLTPIAPSTAKPLTALSRSRHKRSSESGSAS